MNIVSLLPSSTEILYSIGMGKNLVGRSHECDYPEEVKAIPVLTSPKLNTDQSSEMIDQSVNSLFQRGLSVYNVNEPLLKELEPDFIITQSQCELCAVSFRDVEQAVKQNFKKPPSIIDLKPMGYDDISKNILEIGRNLGSEKKATQLVDSMQRRVRSVEQKLIDLPYRKRVFCIEWLKPLMNAGNWIPEIIEKAGGINVSSKKNEHSHYVSWKELLEYDPDVILIMPCGFDVERSRKELHLLTDHPDWQKLKAARDHEFYLLDGNQYFNRPSPRIAEAVEMTAKILYPEIMAA